MPDAVEINALKPINKMKQSEARKTSVQRVARLVATGTVRHGRGTPETAALTEAYRTLENIWSLAPTMAKRKLVAWAKTKTTTNCDRAEYGAAQHILRRASFSGA